MSGEVGVYKPTLLDVSVWPARAEEEQQRD